MAGRKPKPTALKRLTGNPGRRQLNTEEPQPRLGAPDCPDWIRGVAREEWEAIISELEHMGVLAKVDRAALAAYCVSYARWREAEGIVDALGPVLQEPIVNADGDIVGQRHKKNPAVTIASSEKKEMRAFLSLFGMDPSSRSRLRVGPQQEKDPLDDFLGKKPQAQKPSEPLNGTVN